MYFMSSSLGSEHVRAPSIQYLMRYDHTFLSVQFKQKSHSESSRFATNEMVAVSATIAFCRHGRKTGKKAHFRNGFKTLRLSTYQHAHAPNDRP
jgi:hypothetical protein